MQHCQHVEPSLYLGTGTGPETTVTIAAFQMRPFHGLGISYLLLLLIWDWPDPAGVVNPGLIYASTIPSVIVIIMVIITRP